MKTWKVTVWSTMGIVVWLLGVLGQDWILISSGVIMLGIVVLAINNSSKQSKS